MPVKVTRDHTPKRVVAIGEGEFRAEELHLDVAVGPEDDIRGLEGPVYDAASMGGIERVGNLDSDMPCFLEGERAVCQPRLERRAFDDLHDDDLRRAEVFRRKATTLLVLGSVGCSPAAGCPPGAPHESTPR